MQLVKRTTPHTKNIETGFGLIEVLVALLVFAGGVLGIASMQLNGLGMISNSNSLSVAVIAASDMADRMRANPIGVSNGAYDGISGSENLPSCSTTCTPDQIALIDAFRIKEELSNSLSDPTLTVSSVANDMFTISISWSEKIKQTSETKSHRFTFLPYNP